MDPMSMGLMIFGLIILVLISASLYNAHKYSSAVEASRQVGGFIKSMLKEKSGKKK